MKKTDFKNQMIKGTNTLCSEENEVPKELPKLAWKKNSKNQTTLSQTVHSTKSTGQTLQPVPLSNHNTNISKLTRTELPSKDSISGKDIIPANNSSSSQNEQFSQPTKLDQLDNLSKVIKVKKVSSSTIMAKHPQVKNILEFRF